MANRKAIILFVILGSLLIAINFSYLLPFSTDLTTFNDGYELNNAFPELTFNHAVDIQNDGYSDNLYIVEQVGIIWKISNSMDTPQKIEFFNISDTVRCCGETGLLGLAFDPNFINNGYFYVDYTIDNPLTTRISRFTLSNNSYIDYNSEITILEVLQPYSNHNAGSIAFGNDDMLYITLGDGGSANDPQGNSQNLQSLLGSILRINVSNITTENPYSIPSDNPFISDQNVKSEIWAYGLRNPWKISFDYQSDTLWAGDVGQNTYEEINIIQKGGNYGWNAMEGNQCFQNQQDCNSDEFIAPIFQYGRDKGKSITGGIVYRGSLNPNLYGHYIFADYVTGRFWFMDTTNIQDNTPIEGIEFMKYNMYISSFGVDLDDELYVAQYDYNGEGQIFNINAL